ncbi:GMC family oxidoreductase [Pelomonas sp. CA6]|uniref:FAD-dependent oxidoreductase n=1 Tax=Pelomonas sp. CA6 TaxID=2907999 RepID=UPI001F4C25A1|nr:GMC family oxidoreductase [Pelomonas sp. CA6]MCH7343768.1 GMC family oxidoreductase [Pelomonas sp. CA6]
MDAAQALDFPERSHWDCLIVGTGVGGSLLGWSLARAGLRVLFVEKGQNHLTASDALRGGYAELALDTPRVPGAGDAALLRRAGRLAEPLDIQTPRGLRRSLPFIGSGAGGSSALYGMALERFFPCDFQPRAKHAGLDLPLPERWPFDYAELLPFYEEAEALFGLRGSPDPLRPDPVALAEPPGLSPASMELARHFSSRGLHPYHIPLGCRFEPGCRGCQGYLCARDCKRDAATVALAPALARHGAQLLDRCEVTRLETDGRRVSAVHARRNGQDLTLHADLVVLAAGALATPALLLASADARWPRGLANGSDAVGRHLMRHGTDLYAIRTKAAPQGLLKQIAFNDWYEPGNGNEMPLGTVQSFGQLPPASMLGASLLDDLAAGPFALATPLVRAALPLVRPVLRELAERRVVMASICEDLPLAGNRLRLHDGRPVLEYTLHAQDQKRVALMRQAMRELLTPFRTQFIAAAENPAMLAHVCGTCRAGSNPDDSVVDADNRCHELDNLYIVDASFFPSSGGTNPSLTIAANALRVAQRIQARPR